MASEREAKQLEAATEALGGRVADVKSSLGQLIRKMETDPTLNWHSFLDSYALISGQMNSLLKQMRHEKTPLLRKAKSKLMKQHRKKVPKLTKEIKEMRMTVKVSRLRDSSSKCLIMTW